MCFFNNPDRAPADSFLADWLDCWEGPIARADREISMADAAATAVAVFQETGSGMIST